jgi:hypothetical protein
VANYISKGVGDKVTLGVLVVKNGVGMSGLIPTLELRRNSDGAYFNFAAVAAPWWVTSGGQRELVLAESSWQDGYYTWEFDQSLYDPDAVREYTAFYRSLAPNAFIENEVVSFGNFDLRFIRQILANEQDLENVGPSQFRHTVFDDNGAAGGVSVLRQDVALVGNTEQRRHA